jgi:hypothetical protein
MLRSTTASVLKLPGMAAHSYRSSRTDRRSSAEPQSTTCRTASRIAAAVTVAAAAPI